jgi:hypothetical protein
VGRAKRRWARRTAAGLFFLVGLALAFVAYRAHGPNRDYRVDLAVVSSGIVGESAEPLLVGAARREITPRLAERDRFEDRDGDGKYDPAAGDRCEDRNENGRCDLVWLAGFAPNRPALGVNDPLWVRAVAFRNREVTVALASIDAIGLTHEHVIRLRRELAGAHPELTHLVVAATHTHSAPDTLNLWSRRPLLPGLSRFDRGYLERILARTGEAVDEALARLAPAEAVPADITLPGEGWIRDSRRPFVYDRTPRVCRFVRSGSDETIATLLSWGCHPEALGPDNNLVSSDYVHHWREGVEHGLSGPRGASGVGGTAIFFAGAFGGLLTPMGVAVPDRDGQRVHASDGPQKARALGENLALATLAALRDPARSRSKERQIAVVARSVFAPVETLFRWPVLLGLIHPGWYGGKLRTEVDALRIGPLEILALPGEPYPELIEGGVEAPQGADYPGPPREVPPLRGAMQGTVNMVFGLANDEIGYIIPRTEWDVQPPYAYGQGERPYGEEMSIGPSAAGVLHRESLASLERLHALTH